MTHNMHLFLFIALLNYFLYIPKLAVTDDLMKILNILLTKYEHSWCLV